LAGRYKSALMQLALSGDLGVDIFFVLSGFLISFISVREMQKPGGCFCFRSFMWRRWFRLTPMYVAAIGIMVLLDVQSSRANCKVNWWQVRETVEPLDQSAGSHSLTHSLANSLIYSLTHSLTHSLTRSLTHSLTHVGR
jgi:peptidoglycan/LPS O-acetylase OafA/YrhL